MKQICFIPMNCLSYLLSVIPSFSQLLPITAFVAILVFMTKEILEWRRRSAADARKIRALKKVLARDCELNYWAMTQLSDTLTKMRESGVSEDASRISISKRAGGGFLVMVEDGDGSGGGGMLPSIQRDALLKHLVEIAALDESFYAKCESALDGLSEADHVHQSLVHGPDKHFPSTPENYYEGLIDYGLGELNDSAAKLKNLYLACTGSELKRGKLR